MHSKAYGLATSLLFASRFAYAQVPTPDEPTPSPEPTPAPTTTAPAPAPTPAPAVAASTGESPLGTSFGVGVHAMLTGPVGPAVVYNTNRFHLEGLVSLQNADGEEGTDIVLGGRGWLHVHQAKASSLSLGGGIGFARNETEMPDPRGGTMTETSTDIHIEGGAQIRFFATPNVALSASVGLGIISGDADILVLTGQLTGSVGLTYFLF